MEKRLISIRSGAGRTGHGDRRCKRADCIFPQPIIRFDLDGHRVVAVWSWLAVGAVRSSNRLKINVMPTMLLVPMAYN
jgi:hypothetical protein